MPISNSFRNPTQQRQQPQPPRDTPSPGPVHEDPVQFVSKAAKNIFGKLSTEELNNNEALQNNTTYNGIPMFNLGSNCSDACRSLRRAWKQANSTGPSSDAPSQFEKTAEKVETIPSKTLPQNSLSKPKPTTTFKFFPKPGSTDELLLWGGCS